MAQVDEAPAAPAAHLQLLTLTVIWADEDGEFIVPKTNKVSDLIHLAVTRFKLSPTDKYDLMLASGGQPLEHDRTLVSYHLKDGDQLLLTSTAGGV
jgi:putative intracellular protease/amidase